MIQAAFACCREKEIMRQFVFPWKAFKINLTNLINFKNLLKILRDQYTIMIDK